jgi:histone H3/H4
MEMMKFEADEQRSKLVVTAIGKKVHRCLDMAQKTRSLVVVNGVARIGKSFSARTWCEQRPGVARFVEVPPSNDDIGFFRAIARGLGLGNFLNYKAAEIRERVESVLITGQLLLVLDEAHRCWPQRNPRYGFPSRIEWIMSMVNKNVPICTLTTPQFFSHQQRSESTGWASEQFTGRITHHEQLATELSQADLETVARNVMPEAGDLDIAALVAYARSSAKYLAAIDSIAKSSRYLAEENGRAEVRRADIQQAMREGVIPSDRSLASALKATEPKRRKPSLTLPQSPINEPPISDDESDEAASKQPQRSAPGARGGLKILSAGHGREVRPAGDLVGA